MKIFRIEDKEGKGPYQDSWVWKITSHGAEQGRPPPYEDDFPDQDRVIDYDFLHRRPNLRFGFRSITQLFSWFWHLNELEKMYELGYIITCFDTEDKVIYGRTQVVFNRQNAKLIRTFTLDEALEIFTA